jgi:hypothetical protein
MIIYDKIVESPYEPQSTNVLWLRPTEEGFAFYRYKNGKWDALRIMNTKGTTTVDDDTPYDLNGVGAKKLSDLEDVALNTLTDGQILKYNGSSWENGNDDTSTPGPDTVGSEQIMDNSVEMEDLNDSVREKIQKTYDISDESLSMDFDTQS